MKFPIDEWLEPIATSLTQHAAVIVKADPGAGKTTQLPPYLLKHFKKILVIQPRRLAAKLTASWIASQRGEKAGSTVGYHIRHDKSWQPSSRLVFVTEGIFSRMLMQDPLLQEWDAVVLDEFHERHIQSDLALALVHHIQQQRPELKLVIMSATLDSQQLESWLPDYQLFNIPGRMFPVTTEYSADTNKPLDEQVAQAVQKLLSDTRIGDGNILVFLPGRAEIERAEERLLSRGVQSKIIQLSAELAQNYALITDNLSQRKIILATNVAETSLTIPNITAVVDTGLARQVQRSLQNDLPVLELVKVSQASCTQRTGRAGRTAPGVCIRLFSPMEFAARAAFTSPEIQRLELSQTLLELAATFPHQPQAWRHFRWFETAPDATLTRAETLLTALGALSSDGRIQDYGRSLADLSLHPRLAHMVFQGKRQNIGSVALVAALLIQEGISPKDRQGRANAHGDCDVCVQVEQLLEFAKRRHGARGESQKFQRVLQAFEPIARSEKLTDLQSVGPWSEDALRQVIFRAFGDRVAKHRPQAQSQSTSALRPFQLAMGQSLMLSPQSTVQHADWLVAIEAKESSPDGARADGRIYAATAIKPEWLTADPFHMMTQQVETEFDAKNGKNKTWQRTYYGKLLFQERLQGSEHEQESTLAARLLKDWPKNFGDITDLTIYHKQLDLLDRYQIAHKMPRFVDEMLELLITHLCETHGDLAKVRQASLKQAILEQLDEEDRYILSRNCPTQFKLPNGKHIAIHYEEQEPFLEARIQDFFGQQDTPTICGGKHPLLCKLLAPNQRPAQLTSDLRGFWLGSYAVVKKELMRRYPKHAWPDNPLIAEPIVRRKT